jgi:hypothetical protein
MLHSPSRPSQASSTFGARPSHRRKSQQHFQKNLTALSSCSKSLESIPCFIFAAPRNSLPSALQSTIILIFLFRCHSNNSKIKSMFHQQFQCTKTPNCSFSKCFPSIRCTSKTKTTAKDCGGILLRILRRLKKLVTTPTSPCGPFETASTPTTCRNPSQAESLVRILQSWPTNSASSPPSTLPQLRFLSWPTSHGIALSRFNFRHSVQRRATAEGYAP